MYVCAVAGNSASIVVRPLQSPVQQQQLVMNAANKSVPVFCPPNFPTIQQALLGSAVAGDQPVSTASPSAVATVTASVASDPAVIKTLLASKLARNVTQQPQCDVNSSQSTSNTSSVASCSSLSCVSVGSDSPASVSTAAVTVDTAATVSAAGHVVLAGNVDSTVSQNNNMDKTAVVDSNGLTETVSSVSVTLTSSCNVPSSVATSSCLANGHAKPFHDHSLVNGICSPVPSCSSEDQEPPHNVKVPKSSGCGNECDEVVVNGDVLDSEVDDDGSELNDCDGDVLVKAMMQADIIDCGGRPAINDSICDDDSHMSADFLAGFVERTQENVSSVDIGGREQATSSDAGIGFDSETAAAVADLLHETGMMADEDQTAVSHVSASESDNCLLFDSDVTEDNQCIIPAASDELSVPAADETLTLGNEEDSSVSAAVFSQQLDYESSAADVSEQVHVALEEEAEPQLVESSFVGQSSTSNAAVMTAAAALTCSANAASGGALQQQSCSTVPSSTVSSAPATTQLHSGVMMVPPRGLSLPSGQFLSSGTRLLLRPVASIAAPTVNSTPSLSVRLAQSTVAPAVNAQSASTVLSTGSSAVVGGNSQLPECTVTGSTSAPAVRFISSTTSQGQLIIQRAQILGSPLIQRVIVPQTPRPIAMQSEGQVILQPTQANQQIAGRPVLLTQTPFPAGQLRVTAPGMQLVTGSSGHPPTQIVLQSGHVINVQPRQPSTRDIPQLHQSPGQMHIATTNNLPLLAAKPSSEQQQHHAVGDGTESSANQPVIQGAQSQMSTNVKPPLRPLISTSQQPVQIVGGPLQLRAGLVSLPAGSGNASVFLQNGGRPILLQSPNVGSAQHPSSYVVFRPGALPVPSSQEHVNNIAVSSASLSSSASSSSLGPDTASRKRPLPPLSATVTRSLRKKTKKDEDNGLPFMCEWSHCQRWLFLWSLIAVIVI